MVSFIQVLAVFGLSLAINEAIIFILKKLFKSKALVAIIAIPAGLALSVEVINLTLPLQDYGTLGNAIGTLLASLAAYFGAQILILLINLIKKGRSTLREEK